MALLLRLTRVALQDEVARLQDEIERRGAGFYIPLAKEVFNSTESINAITETLGVTTTATAAKDADAIPATVVILELIAATELTSVAFGTNL